jgi:hypothetical protein
MISGAALTSLVSDDDERVSVLLESDRENVDVLDAARTRLGDA